MACAQGEDNMICKLMGVGAKLTRHESGRCNNPSKVPQKFATKRRKFLYLLWESIMIFSYWLVFAST